VPVEQIAAVTAALLAGIRNARNPLAGEMVLCGALGSLEAGLPEDADEQTRLQMLTLMLGEVISEALALATVDALALLRVCSVLGPVSTQDAAGEAVGQLVAAGVADRPWAGRVGHPMMLRAWRFGDAASMS